MMTSCTNCEHRCPLHFIQHKQGFCESHWTKTFSGAFYFSCWHQALLLLVLQDSVPVVTASGNPAPPARLHLFCWDIQVDSLVQQKQKSTSEGNLILGMTHLLELLFSMGWRRSCNEAPNVYTSIRAWHQLGWLPKSKLLQNLLFGLWLNFHAVFNWCLSDKQ